MRKGQPMRYFSLLLILLSLAVGAKFTTAQTITDEAFAYKSDEDSAELSGFELSSAAEPIACSCGEEQGWSDRPLAAKGDREDVTVRQKTTDQQKISANRLSTRTASRAIPVSVSSLVEEALVDQARDRPTRS